MTLLYASTFTDALGRLSAAEQKQAKLTAFDLQLDPRGNGLQMHRIEKAPGFWSVRVSGDIRIILYKQDDTTLLAYVDHHDAAYRWAERKRVVAHERTGAMQFVEVPIVAGPAEDMPETAAEPPLAAPTPPRPEHLPFAGLTDDQMLDVGVPRDWLAIVRAATEEGLFDLLEKLPAEAAEALLDHATGGKIESHVTAAEPGIDPFAHPDAQRRFRVVENLDELKAALDQPFAQWAVFLHPSQRALVERNWTGPARVSGSAGTGKTIVALHRAAHLVRHDVSARVLLTTFSKPLAMALAARRDILAESHPEARERIAVQTLDQAAIALFTRSFAQPTLASEAQIRAAIAAARKQDLGAGMAEQFLFEEWEEVVDAWGLGDGAAYAAVPRIGRRTRLGPQQRENAWAVFAFVRDWLAQRKLVTVAQVYGRLTEHLAQGGALPFSHVVVDEAQDLSVAQVRFLAQVGRVRPDALFLAGDIGQRIFHLPFSWARLGLDVRGRSHCLKVNYRTSHQIRAAADKLLPASIADLDGIEEGRRGTVSVFDGPVPLVVLAHDEAEETAKVGGAVRGWIGEGVPAAEIALLVRSDRQLARARAAIKAAGLNPRDEGGVAIATMYAAKGLEYRAVAVIACDEDVLPDPERLGAVGDVADLEAAYETERHLLYVACTRARDRLLVSAVAPGSEFLEDLGRG